MKRKLRKISCILVGGIGVLLFISPLFLYNILNIGNVTGLLVFGCILTYGIVPSAIHRFFGQWYQTKVGKWLLRIAEAMIVLTIVLVLVMSTKMFQAILNTPKDSVTVVVLGCQVKGENASLMLQERIDAAYDYLAAHPDASAVLSGGKGAGEAISEAECMYRALTKKGIAEERLYKEERSTSTRENLAFSKDIIEQNRLSNSLAIVTNEFHEYRAKQIAKNLGFDAKAVPAPTAWWLFPTYYVRELYGILYQWIL